MCADKSPASPPRPPDPTDHVPSNQDHRTAPLRRGDVAITLLLIVVLAGLGLIAMMLGLYGSMAAGACDDDHCIDQVGRLVVSMTLAPVVAWVPTTVWAVVRMRRRQVAWWVPLVSVPVYLVLAAVGLSLFEV